MPASSEIILRKADLEDLPAILILEKQCFSSPWSFPRFSEEVLQEEFLYLLVCFHGKILGYCLGRHLADEFEILRIAVSRENRKQGLGKTLLNKSISLVREAGTKRIFLEVEFDNDSAIALYFSRSFSCIGGRQNYYGRDRHALLLELVL